jgi:hypothetical protein
MIEAVERRFGKCRAPSVIEMLSDHGSRFRPSASHHCVAAESHRCSGGFRIKIQGRPQLSALATLS